MGFCLHMGCSPGPSPLFPPRFPPPLLPALYDDLLHSRALCFLCFTVVMRSAFLCFTVVMRFSCTPRAIANGRFQLGFAMDSDAFSQRVFTVARLPAFYLPMRRVGARLDPDRGVFYLISTSGARHRAPVSPLCGRGRGKGKKS